MTPQEFKATRKWIGLSINQLAAILDVSPVTIRRWEMTSGKASARKPDPIACRVLEWMDSGALSFWGWLPTGQLDRIAYVSEIWSGVYMPSELKRAPSRSKVPSTSNGTCDLGILDTIQADRIP